MKGKRDPESREDSLVVSVRSWWKRVPTVSVSRVGSGDVYDTCGPEVGTPVERVTCNKRGELCAPL